MALDLIITGRTAATRWLNSPSRKGQIRAVISIGAEQGHMLSPNRGNPHGFSAMSCSKIRLEFDDINTEFECDSTGRIVYRGPTRNDMERLVKFADRVDIDGEGYFLIHCYVGRCRSTAAAYIIYCLKWGKSRAYEAADHIYTRQAMFQRRGWPAPNTRMIKLASDIVGWDMQKALQEYQEERILNYTKVPRTLFR